MGNRYDLPHGGNGVLYFGSSLEVCFGEVLARLRPDPRLVEFLQEEWRKQGFMELGAVSADWRSRRSAVRVLIGSPELFLDVDAPESVSILEDELAFGLSSLGYTGLTPEMIHDKDRRVTRLISQWTYFQQDEEGRPLYAGIRFTSWLNAGWECWAVYGDVDFEVVEKRPITTEMPELQLVAGKYGLTIH